MNRSRNIDTNFALTQAGDRMGTARYMAPEQWSNAAGIDHRADLYSLGVLFCEMLTGDPPTPQCRPPSAKAGTDRRLDKVVSKSLQDEPDERYQQAGRTRRERPLHRCRSRSVGGRSDRVLPIQPARRAGWDGCLVDASRAEGNAATRPTHSEHFA